LPRMENIWWKGILYLDLSDAATRRLDAFEGGMYDRREVVVTLEGGAARTVMTYIFRPEFRHLLTDVPGTSNNFSYPAGSGSSKAISVSMNWRDDPDVVFSIRNRAFRTDHSYSAIFLFLSR